MKKTLLRLGVSALLLAVLFTLIADIRDVWADVRRIAFPFLTIAFASVAVDRTLMAYKWLLLLRSVNRGVPLLRGLMIYCSATLLGSALPVTVGGDVIRGVFATRAGIGGEHVVASIIVERMIGFLACMSLGVGSLLFLRSTHELSGRYDLLIILAIMAFGGAALLVLASFNRRATALVLSMLPHKVRELSIAHKFERLLEAYRELGAERTTLAVFAILTLFEQLLPIVMAWVVAMGMGVAVNPVWLFCALTLSLILARLPISIDGLGVFEGFFAGFMTLAGVPPHESVAIALTGRALQFVFCLPWWIIFSRRYGITGRATLPTVATQDQYSEGERKEDGAGYRHSVGGTRSLAAVELGCTNAQGRQK